MNASLGPIEIVLPASFVRQNRTVHPKHFQVGAARHLPVETAAREYGADVSVCL
jgi:hypothetical protein